MTTHPQRLVSLWDMLRNYFPIYKIGIDLQNLRRVIGLFADSPRGSVSEVHDHESAEFERLVHNIQEHCSAHGLNVTAEMAGRLLSQPLSKTYGGVFADLNHLDGSLGSELNRELAFRIPPERLAYYEQDELFGAEVAAAFPSCARDIRKAGSCYALGQEDACVFHLMLVLERGLNALAGKFGVPFHHTNWQTIIDQIKAKLDHEPRGPVRDFYIEVNAQFGFLKDAYRNHSQHARDDPYDLPKALSILNHVRDFMQALTKGGLSE